MNSLAFIGRIGSGELLLILLVFLVLFGAKKIPELARGLGKGIREFKNATKELSEELEDQPKEKKDG
jgi:sec-independent protein translocase protein TatA